MYRCMRTLGSTDSVLFLEDGCYNTLPEIAPLFLSGFKEVDFYALEADVLARGLASRAESAIAVVDDAAFVELTTRHHPILSWY